MDPNATESFEGEKAGPGAIMRWSGNNEVGEGSMTILESKPNELITMRLDFIRPFAGTNSVEFFFKPQGNETFMIWTMAGKTNFMTKAIGLVMNCDKMVGDQFDQGLSNLKDVVEGKK